MHEGEEYAEALFFLDLKRGSEACYIKVFELFSKNIVCEEEWRKDSLVHRDDGPARIFYKDGKVTSRQYWLEDKKVLEEIL